MLRAALPSSVFASLCPAAGRREPIKITGAFPHANRTHGNSQRCQICHRLNLERSLATVRREPAEKQHENFGEFQGPP